LPNIAPSLLLCLPLHSCHHRLLRPPCERPHGLSNGVLIADADAHQPCHATVADSCHVTGFRWSLCLPHHSYRPPLIQGCGRAHCRHQRLLTPTNHAMSLAFNGPCICHTAATALPLSRNLGKRHPARRPLGVGRGSRRGREKNRMEKGKPQVGRRAFVPPPVVSFWKPARRRASHTPPHLTFRTQTRRRASHTPLCSTS
jgi:hypothetical protein